MNDDSSSSSSSDDDDSRRSIWQPYQRNSQSSNSSTQVIDLTNDVSHQKPKENPANHSSKTVAQSTSTLHPLSKVSSKKAASLAMFDELLSDQATAQADARKAAENQEIQSANKSGLPPKLKFSTPSISSHNNVPSRLSTTQSSTSNGSGRSSPAPSLNPSSFGTSQASSVEAKIASFLSSSVPTKNPVSKPSSAESLIDAVVVDASKSSVKWKAPVRKGKNAPMAVSEQSIAEAFQFMDELKKPEKIDWQEHFLHTVLSWDMNAFYREALAGPPIPPFAAMASMASANNSTSSAKSAPESTKAAQQKLLLDPASYVGFASEREYVLFFEFLLIEDFKARVLGPLVESKNRGVSARLTKWFALKQQPFIDLTVFLNESDIRNWGSQDLVLIEFDGSTAIVRHANSSSSSSSASSASVCQELHILSMVQSIDSASSSSSSSQSRRQVRLRILPLHNQQAIPSAHFRRLTNFFSAISRLTSNSTSAGSSSSSSSSSSDRIELSVRLTHLESMTTSLREYLALHAIPPASGNSVLNETESVGSLCPEVRRDILMPGSSQKLSVSHIRKHSIVKTLPARLYQHIQSDLNESQLDALHSATQVDPSTFVLLQGPPGTGKTKVVIKILNVLHLHYYLLHYDSLVRTLSVRIQQSIQASRNKSSKQDQSTSWSCKTLEQIAQEVRSAAGVSPKPRFLVCAPSNAAVDEIIERLSTLKLRDGDLNQYDPDMVRIGSSDKMRDAVSTQLSLDARVDQFLTMTSEELSVTKNQARKELASCQLDLRQMEEYARQNYDSLFGDNANPDSRLSFSSDLVRAYDNVHRQRVVLERCQIVTEAGPDKTFAKDKLQLSFLNEAQIVFSTLSGAGMRILNDLERGFDRCIVDEAGQCVELSVLIPLRLRVRSCILVGDPRQLPATCFLNGPVAKLYERSLFERFEQAGYPVQMLRTQYRMHPQICKFPSQHFYDDKLINAASVSGSSHTAFFHQNSRFAPYLFWDLEGMESRQGGSSLSNSIEAQFIANQVASLLRVVPPERRSDLVQQIGVITPYSQQRVELMRALASKLPADLLKLMDVATVDSFQGREKDVIIISCVRALTKEGESDNSGSIGFVADRRRLNVAITRARLALWVVGDSRALDRSPDWRLLIDDAIARRVYRRASEAEELDTPSSSKPSDKKRNMSRREQQYWLRQERSQGDVHSNLHASGGKLENSSAFQISNPISVSLVPGVLNPVALAMSSAVNAQLPASSLSQSSAAAITNPSIFSFPMSAQPSLGQHSSSPPHVFDRLPQPQLVGSVIPFHQQQRQSHSIAPSQPPPAVVHSNRPTSSSSSSSSKGSGKYHAPVIPASLSSVSFQPDANGVLNVSFDVHASSSSNAGRNQSQQRERDRERDRSHRDDRHSNRRERSPTRSTQSSASSSSSAQAPVTYNPAMTYPVESEPSTTYNPMMGYNSSDVTSSQDRRKDKYRK